MKPKLKSIKKLKKQADTVFSLHIRKRDSHKCYTCGKIMEPKESQNGHYKSRIYLYLRYNLINCHAQCVSCNIFKNGNLTIYALNLIRDYGPDILQRLEERKNQKILNTRKFLQNIIDTYGNLLR